MKRLVPLLLLLGLLVLVVEPSGAQRARKQPPDGLSAAGWALWEQLLSSARCTAPNGPCDLTAGTTVNGVPITGGGETNTGSNLGGGLANYSTKVGSDLRFNSFEAADFDLAANLLTIDATKWLTIVSAAAAYQPLDTELTDVADGIITSVLGVLAAANTNTTALATTSFVQQEIDDVDLLSDNCVLENDATPIPDSCVGDGTDSGGGGGGISYADAAAAVLAGF